ncbi:MAG TPA: 50S ribosomal protein L9 [Firmicutes bacterium]|nr:50S ribosomal protein L9 [Candidatus Fermentithermobacillaceae bacterium]
MEVVLKQDVPGLGKKGQLVSVKDGYARNYLFPKGLAVPATKGAIKEQESLNIAKKEKEDRNLQEARVNASKIEGKTLVFYAKAGHGRIFGSITPQEIANKIKSSYKVDVDKRKVLLEENLKELGVHEVIIQLHPQVRAKVSVEIRPEVGT